MRRTARSLLLAAAFLGACSDDPVATGRGPGGGTDNGGGDNGGQAPTGRLEAAAHVYQTEVGPVTADPPWIECTFTVSANYVGQAGVEATITGAVFRFHAGYDRSAPLDSTVVSLSEVRQGFGGDAALESGDTIVSGWRFRANVPFGLTGSLRWSEDGGDVTRDAPFEITCGPVLTDQTPPTLTNARITPAGDSIEAGTSMTVEFDVASDLGLWETWLMVTSPSRTDTIQVSERLRTSATRSITVRHAPGSAQGERLQIQVVTFDAWLRPAASPLLTSPGVYDTQPPTVYDYYINFDHHVCNARGCQFASDTLIPFRVNAFDGGALGYARLEIGDPVAWRDSALVGWGGSGRFPTDLAGLDGVYPVRGSIADAVGNRVERDLGELNVYPAFDASGTTELLKQTDHQVLPDFAAARIYLVPASGPIETYDLTTLTRLGDLQGPASNGPADLSPSGSLVIASADGDTIGFGYESGSPARMVIDRSALPADLTVSAVVATATGTAVVVLQGDAGRSAVLEIDPANTTQRLILETPTGSSFDATRLARSGDGRKVVIYLVSGCARLYDVVTRALGGCANIPATITGDADGDRWASSHMLYDAALAPVSELDSEGGYPAAPGPDGFTYVANRRGLLRYDEATGLIRESRRVQEYVPVTYFAAARLHLSPDGSLAVVAGRPQSGVNTEQTLVSVVRLD